MRKYIVTFTNIAICIIIIVGAVCIFQLHFKALNRMMGEDAENIAKMASEQMYEHLRNHPEFFAGQAPDEWIDNHSRDGAKETQRVAPFEKMMYTYETEYGVQVLLIDANGIIQFGGKTGQDNFFDDKALSELKEDMLGNRDTSEIFRYNKHGFGNFIVTRYLEDLDLYVITQKNTDTLQPPLKRLIRQNMAVILIVFVSIFFAVRMNNQIIETLSNTDYVTKLPNFERFTRLYKKKSKSAKLLFIMDVDNFKDINDKKGHIYANSVLETISKTTRHFIGKDGVVARWGGDEFVGMLNISSEQSVKMFELIIKELNQIYKNNMPAVSLSIGITSVNKDCGLEELLEQADQAMYESKYKGGSRLTYYDTKRSADIYCVG